MAVQHGRKSPQAERHPYRQRRTCVLHERRPTVSGDPTLQIRANSRHSSERFRTLPVPTSGWGAEPAGKVLTLSRETLAAAAGRGNPLSAVGLWTLWLRFSFRRRGEANLLFVQKFVIENRGREPESVFGIVDRVFSSNQPTLAEYVAVFLPGDLFRHLEDQFHQCVCRQLLRAMKHHA